MLPNSSRQPLLITQHPPPLYKKHMQGFDSKFKTFPDYILGITYEIWENRGIDTLHTYYSPEIIVRSPGSVVKGNKGVIAATMSTLAEFPDRRLLGEDVIWCGSPEQGMLSSHRIVSTATHSHDGVYGTASGTKLRYRVLADCHAINNQINDEWLIRDQTAIVKQLGISPQDYARDLIQREGGVENCIKPFTPEIDIPGPYQARGNDHSAGQELAGILQEIFSANFRIIDSHYDRAANLYYPGGEVALSTDAARDFWLGLRASFPNADFRIEHAMGREDPSMPPRAALRWSLDGLHEGWGRFGAPSHKRVHIMGITQAEFGTWGLRRDYTLFDETAIWKQIYIQQG